MDRRIPDTKVDLCDTVIYCKGYVLPMGELENDMTAWDIAAMRVKDYSDKTLVRQLSRVVREDARAWIRVFLSN